MSPRPFVILSASLIALSLGACSIAPERDDVSAVLPEAFLSDGAQSTAAQWWLELNDSALNTLMDQALRDNLDLQIVDAQLRAAQAGLRAAGSGLWPTVTASGARSGGFEDGSDGTYNSVELAASYEIDLWGRVRANRASAALTAQASAEELAAARITLSANLATLWYQIGSSRQRLQLIEQERARYTQILQLVQHRFRYGQAEAAEVLQQQQLLESTRALEASTVADLGTLQHALDELLAQPAAGAQYDGGSLQPLPPLPQTGVPADVVNRRPDVRQSWMTLLAADRDVAAAVANRFPQLGLNISYSSAESATVDLFDQWIGSIIGSLTAPLIDGGARRAEVARTRAVYDAQLSSYRQSVLGAFREIQDALLQERQQQQVTHSLDEQLRLSDAAVQRLVAQLRNGGIQYPALLDAQITNSELRRNLLSARQQHLEYRIALYRALAGPVPEAS